MIESAPGRCSQLRQKFRIDRTASQGDRELVRIFGWHDQTVHSVANPLANAPDVCADHRLAQRHCFQDGNGHGFVTRRRNNSICFIEKGRRFRMIECTDQFHILKTSRPSLKSFEEAEIQHAPGHLERALIWT